MKTKILADFQICFSVPLKFFKTATLKNAGEQPLLKVAYYSTFMINKLDLL